MELCNGKSLSDLLKMPENQYGLEDEILLPILLDIS